MREYSTRNSNRLLTAAFTSRITEHTQRCFRALCFLAVHYSHNWFSSSLHHWWVTGMSVADCIHGLFFAFGATAFVLDPTPNEHANERVS